MSGFGDLEGGFDGYFEEVAEGYLLDPSEDFSVITEGIDDIDLPIANSTSIPDMGSIPIPNKAPIPLVEKKRLEALNRQDKPIIPSSEILSKLKGSSSETDAQEESPVTEPKEDITPENLPKKRVFDGYKNPKNPLNKIVAPDFEVSLDSNLIPDSDIDVDLRSLASGLEVFSVEAVSENQIISPSSAEFIAQYYRVISVMAYKVALNKTVSAIRVDGMWANGLSLVTINNSSTHTYIFDAIYMHCTQDEVVKSFRGMYDSKRVYFSKMTVQQILGAGHGISSAKQASMYLEKMAMVSLSSALGMLCYQEDMFDIRQWYEANITDKSARGELLRAIQKIINQNSVAQAKKYASDSSIVTRRGRRYFLFAKKYLNRGISVHVSNQQLQLSALKFFLSGIDMYQPTPKNIGFVELTEKLIENKKLSESFDKLTYESHRHCYPINELSFF